VGVEIERKFLVKSGWLPETPGTRYIQGYLVSGRDGATVRVRVAGKRAYLTVKGPSEGAKRLEFEYPVPVEDARLMLKALAKGSIIEKFRHLVEHAGHTWEVDVFQGENEGLVVAELELKHLEEPVMLPDWVRAEVTEDRRYANAYLSRYPYREWPSEEP